MGRRQENGVYVVEFALIGLLLFVLLFGVLEMGRLLFAVNTLNEVVRRGARLAAVCDIQDPDVLRRAVFAETGEVTSAIVGGLATTNLKLRYLDESGVMVSEWSKDGAFNKNLSSNDFSKIRFVEVRVEGFSFNLLIPVVGGPITLETFRSVLPRESLGRYPEGAEITKC